MKHPVVVETSAHESEETGLPLFRTWRAVYFLVLASFVLWVSLLILLTETFS